MVNWEEGVGGQGELGEDRHGEPREEAESGEKGGEKGGRGNGAVRCETWKKVESLRSGVQGAKESPMSFAGSMTSNS